MLKTKGFIDPKGSKRDGRMGEGMGGLVKPKVL
jgi:hypothetical protein